MIRTLKTYLAIDLARAAALAVVAFTLVMTVFAVIEPLRERGLSSQQALKLFGFSMPVMVSLTLPIAALFAATMVYGRFAQDNELMASRASGICPISLLMPAIWLGLIVTAVTLTLGLYVAPRLLWQAQYTVKANLPQIAFHGLRSKGRIEIAGQIFHADHVDPDTGWMAGVVALDTSDRDDAAYLVAAKARLQFPERDGRTFVSFDPVNYVFRRQSGGTMAMMEREQIRRGELPSLFEYEPKLYNWTQLLQARSRPHDMPIVRREVQKIRRKLCVLMFYEDLLRAVEDRGRYARLDEFATWGQAGRTGWIEIRASSAKLHEDRQVVLGPQAPPPAGAPAQPRTVVVRQGEGGRLKREYVARRADVTARWDDFYSANLITVELEDVLIRELGTAAPAERTRRKEEIGPYAVPAEIRQESEKLDLADLDGSLAGLRFVKRAIAVAGKLDANIIHRLLAKVSAEIHLRLAYGVSCLFMVMLGAALGLLFRGGQMLVAFAISAVPASLVIMLLFMGKELIKSPGVEEGYGVGVIWGGIAALALATAYVYVVHMRR